MKIKFTGLDAAEAAKAKGALVIGVLKDEGLSPVAAMLDEASGGTISRAFKVGKLTGKAGETLGIVAPQGLACDRVILVGLGARGDLGATAAENAGGHAAAALSEAGEMTAVMDALSASDEAAGLAARFAFGARLRTYRFDKYRTKGEDKSSAGLAAITVQCEAADKAKKEHDPLDAVADGVFLARDLVNEPANVLHPEEFAKRASKLSKLGVEVEVLGEKEMKKLGMNTLLAVGMGSERESQLVVMRWQGAKDKDAAPLVLVGKGVCFDTGGISLKPAAKMEEMTMDMGGAAAVTGTMHALAKRKARANVVGIIGLVENMPDGRAQRPGDVVTSMSGQTVEVINTDAEGRLVLCDALWYAQDRFKPKAMIDLATLTGAIIISLGHEYAGLFSNDDALAGALSAAGEASGEGVWRFPMSDAYDKKLKSRVADMANVSGGRDAGSITAAQFLKRFVNDVPWAHLDIAGTAYVSEDKPTVPKHGTGFGVRLLDRLVAESYED
ncbi:MAG: leucyl aminopeptidase [Alphaproteobacteria bacterium]|nr:leucyl aminopeptidase [Alphaproteobacteria bacterium]MDX5368409.1 leucyl aminopeptidase [Alphaproteobacteria bacterium]MDX5463204.1 leucyl aminopeptidase [Alphaproteobacteria bacterium]